MPASGLCSSTARIQKHFNESVRLGLIKVTSSKSRFLGKVVYQRRHILKEFFNCEQNACQRY